MHYLLSNDDGYQATGLKLLAEALKKSGEVTVVAPERDRSGARCGKCASSTCVEPDIGQEYTVGSCVGWAVS